MKDGRSRQALHADYLRSAHSLRRELRSLWDEADGLWERSQGSDSFRGYVSADYDAVFRALLRLRPRALTFLEWGSGLGVVTIMASRLGFDAYGIEHEPELVAHAHAFGARYAPAARFVCGDFLPREWAGTPGRAAIAVRPALPGPTAYERVGRKLSDFDVVYAYPWPDEHQLFQNVMYHCGGRHSLFLTYDVRRGIELRRCRR